jgi:hypothetical protein
MKINRPTQVKTSPLLPAALSPSIDPKTDSPIFDMVAIDQPIEAALLPILDPAVLWSLGIATDNLSARGRSTLSIASSCESDKEKTEMWSHSQFQGSGWSTNNGFVGSEVSRGLFKKISDRAFQWESDFGPNSARLLFSQDGNKTLLQGHLGSVDVDLHLIPQAQGFKTVGTLGHRPFDTGTEFHQDEKTFSLLNRGTIDGQETERTYQGQGIVSESRTTLSISGEGSVGSNLAAKVRVFLDQIKPVR